MATETATIDDQTLRAIEPILYRFALRAVRNSDLARDLSQDAMLAAVAAAPSFAGRSSVRTWVIGILSHKIIDHFRKHQPAAPSGAEPDLLQTASPQDLEQVVIAKQELSRVERALGELPQQERLALLMTDVEGLERSEVCNALGLSATHLRVLLHRGRNRVRRMLEHDR